MDRAAHVELTSGQDGSYQPEVRAQEKQRAREVDARALASGEKSLEELRRERGSFAFPHVRIDLDGVLAFE